MNELALFAGAGGGILGGHLLGWRTVCAVEWEPYPASVLVARQNDKVLPSFPIWDDVQTFDGKPWRGIAQVVSGGFPCQDISAAGKGKGITGERSSMWKHMARIIGEVRPQYVLVENSPMLSIRGLGVVLGDLSEMGFNAEWGVISAGDIGAPHLRERIWVVATNVANSNSRMCGGGGTIKTSRNDSNGQLYNSQSEQTTHDIWSKTIGCSSVCGEKNVGDSKSARFTSCFKGQGQRESWGASIGTSQWWEIEPPLDRVVDGMADRVDRLKAIGNGQVPLCAATAWRILSGCS